MLLVGKRSRQTQIGYLEIPLLVNQYIGRLDVTVYQAGCFHRMGHASAELQGEIDRQRKRNPSRFDPFSEVTRIGIFEKQVRPSGDFVDRFRVDDIAVIFKPHPIHGFPSKSKNESRVASGEGGLWGVSACGSPTVKRDDCLHDGLGLVITIPDSRDEVDTAHSAVFDVENAELSPQQSARPYLGNWDRPISLCRS